MTLLSEEQEDHDDDLLDDIVNLDEGDGEVVRGGVEPLDGGHHAAVVNCTQELRLVEENFINIYVDLCKYGHLLILREE